ncbi:MAG: response regulator [Anaerolineae bacterium]|jgi:CheY-like chemotaxis protein|nr:response regulator [Anaerolineae bacterium]MBT7072509.1 response regulator [Anaerolineae bacterium]MBT7602819.1 response regulator [Anaerolineae bacterium]MBT7989750.1 response regulator [Anaerolineae bacterium]
MQFSKKILYAEDDPNDIELTMMALKEYNLANQVVSVKNGVEALDYLYQRGKFADRPDGHPLLVLLDNKMPKKNGLEVLREVKADPELKRIPVVMLTSSKEDRDILESYDLGVNAYVVKPVIFHDFIEAVKTLGLFWLLTNEPPR